LALKSAALQGFSLLGHFHRISFSGSFSFDEIYWSHKRLVK
jgi:hypothetical protein